MTAPIRIQRSRARNTLYCSFCGKAQCEVRKLIAGPGWVFICDECVSLCVDVVAAECHGSREMVEADIGIAPLANARAGR